MSDNWAGLVFLKPIIFKLNIKTYSLFYHNFRFEINIVQIRYPKILLNAICLYI